MPEIKSATVLVGIVDCKTEEVLDTYGCVTESVRCNSFAVGKITCVGPTEVCNILE